MANLFIFNPEHELALANNNENFLPKQNIAKLKKDLQILPVWLQNKEQKTYLLDDYLDEKWENIAQKLQLKYYCVDEIPYSKITSLNVWGWDKSIRKELILSGIDKNILPSDEYLEDIRELSHRKIAVEAMSFLRNELKINTLPYPAEILQNSLEIENFAKKYSDIVLKSPFSSSGRGVYFSGKDLSNSILGWCKKTIAQQGCVLGEKRFEVVKNFAMEFEIVDNQTNFVGYSLFETDGKIYRSNFLTSDEKIEKIICNYGRSLSEIEALSQLLNAVKQTLIKFFNQKTAKKYSGFLGVDMFVFQENGKNFINPCVEINLRYTMGLAAHEFYKNFVSQNSEGIFSIDFYENSAELYQNHKQNLIDKPLIIKDNKIIKGYFSLCPIFENTNYRARVEIY